MQLHILNNPKDAALAADAEFLKQSLFNLLHEEASPLVVETVKLLSTSDDSAALIEKVLPQLDEQQTHDLTLACGLFAQILNIAEDVHHERRRQIHEEAGHSGAEGSLTETRAQAQSRKSQRQIGTETTGQYRRYRRFDRAPDRSATPNRLELQPPHTRATAATRTLH